LRGVGTATVVTGCAKPGDRDAQHPDTVTDANAPAEIGPDAVSVAFTLNGKQVVAQVEPRITLLSALRDELKTTGPKLVCDRGACGACTVMVDGIPRNSCMMLAHDVAGANVTTVEGLATGDELSALQRAFVKHDALQCGFCTSGMLVSSAALLRRHAAKGGKLSADEVRHAISGNLCRCGTYPHVIAAVIEASGGKAGA
jgi:aerobic-type carbon monoxide dehydrogenase small subunit (CoxS/CutS family)